MAASLPDGAPEIVDQALSSLPDPPRRMRTIALVTMVATMLVAGGLAWSVRGEARYGWQSLWRTEPPVDLGPLADAPLAEHAGGYVSGTVALVAERAVEREWPFERDRQRIAPAEGAGGLWVQYRVPAQLDGPRFVPPRLVAGRLVRTSELGPSHRGLAPQLGPGFLLIDGEDPSRARWAVGLMALLAAIALWNAYSIARVLRPTKA